jgi:putative transposase
VTLSGQARRNVMPWKESDTMTERAKFVLRAESGERMTDLCKEFGISRKTGYKFLERFKKLGLVGLRDEERGPANIPWRTPEATQQLILGFKKKHPTWGAKKLKSELEKQHPGVRIPARSTIGALLDKHGLVKHRKPRRRATTSLAPLTPGLFSNDVWCADFKGEFRLGNRRYCYPLTITDHSSRYLIACEGLENTRGEGAYPVFERAFKTYGLPKAIRTDNGSPFASTGLKGLTKLSVWWLRLGIELQRIEPGHPEQNGRHERFHLTLKTDTTRPPAVTFLQQQERFDRFIAVYNHERPHESLDMKHPADFYEPSEQTYREVLDELEYPHHDTTRKISSDGHMSLWGARKRCYVTQALAGERVGLREVKQNRWLVSFLTLDLGHVDAKTFRFEPLA